MNELFLKIINMSISASWLILAVLILRLVLKKAPKWVNVLLWGIVAVRLICPFSFESALSLIPSSETIPLDIEMAAKPTIDSGVPAINSVVNPVLSSFAPPQHVLTSANPLQIWIPILNIIWLIGVGAILLYTAVSYWRLCRKVDTAVRYKDNIFQSENVSSPFVLGIIKPRIYLPFNMNGQDLEHVVAHEQAHIRRKDHWWKPLGFFLLTIYWFNPLMWLAYVLLCRDIELACDEKVIKELGNEQRADYTQALVACSVNRRMIAACPLAFGEVGVKDRVKSVMNYKKPAFWIIILAVIACVIVAVCFLTNPMGFQFDESIHTIVSANYFDMRNADDTVAIEMNPAQISELSSRLARVKNTKKSDEYGGFTPGYQISALLKDGTYIRINGYSFSNNSMVDIEWNGERYVVSDGEFQDYLSRICAGGDVAVAEPVPSVAKWFDYLETPDEMQWGDRHEINLPEFQDVTFRWTYGEMMAVTGNEITSLYTGMPIWNAYFCDLTGDGLPELCSTISWGFGMIDNRVIIYDYANGASYELSDRGNFDFTLRLHEADGYLYVDKKKYNTDELVETGRLVFKNNCIQIEGFSNEAHQVFQAEILEDHNGYYLVKPVEGSWELNSADRIEVPIRNAHPSPEPEIGDVIEIEYSGEILETYPARIADVYGIKVIKQTETWDLIPMVMVNGTLYLDTGHESKIEARCGVMDGEITSQVDGNKQPSVDNQSNFGTGYGYQYGATEGTIELFMNGKWWIFATEEARQKIQFPSIEDEISKFYLTIGSEGVKSIKLSMPNSSGGFENADGSLLKKGERIWLENLDGYTDLRGLTITALGENGEIIWTASIPDEEENKGFTHLVNDDWEITNIE
jgi:beta-lactamase regulating signal transducer with metallopeptidase domain